MFALTRFPRVEFPITRSLFCSERQIKTLLKVCDPKFALSEAHISCTTGQDYHLPLDDEQPELDAFTHVSVWRAHLQTLLGRPLQQDDYLFPAIASTGALKFGEAMNRSGIEVLLDTVVTHSGVMDGRNGKFTTHCFRRGGAQYRFMWAKRKWSLKAVKWWGG